MKAKRQLHLKESGNNAELKDSKFGLAVTEKLIEKVDIEAKKMAEEEAAGDKDAFEHADLTQLTSMIERGENLMHCKMQIHFKRAKVNLRK